MKSLFIIPLFLLSLVSFPSWGDVDKKGLICQCQKCFSYKLERGYWFQDGKVKPRLFGQKQDLITTIERDGLNFTTTSDEILWWETFEFKLNRENLTLETFSGGELETRSNCNVFDKSGFERKWDALRNKHQMSYNKTLKKNKI